MNYLIRLFSLALSWNFFVSLAQAGPLDSRFLSNKKSNSQMSVNSKVFAVGTQPQKIQPTRIPQNSNRKMVIPLDDQIPIYRIQLTVIFGDQVTDFTINPTRSGSSNFEFNDHTRASQNSKTNGKLGREQLEHVVATVRKIVATKKLEKKSDSAPAKQDCERRSINLSLFGATSQKITVCIGQDDSMAAANANSSETLTILVSDFANDLLQMATPIWQLDR